MSLVAAVVLGLFCALATGYVVGQPVQFRSWGGAPRRRASAQLWLVQAGAAHLTDDDPIRTHPEGGHHEVSDVHLLAALGAWRPGFQTGHVPLPKLQLCRVLDGHDALVIRHVPGEDVQQGCLACARATADQNVGSCHHTGLKERKTGRAAASQSHQVRRL